MGGGINLLSVAKCSRGARCTGLQGQGLASDVDPGSVLQHQVRAVTGLWLRVGAVHELAETRNNCLAPISCRFDAAVPDLVGMT